MEVIGYTPEDLIDTASDLLSRTDAKSKGIWPRAAAHLCRQALEAGLATFWANRVPGLEQNSMRAQLACLSVYVDEEDLAGRVGYTWAALSAACHHHVYELAPGLTELSSWIATTRELLTVTAGRT